MDSDELGLVADVGRVSVRFGICGGELGPAPRDIRHYHTADYSTFTSALVDYLTALGLRDQPLPSMLAVAGAVRGDLINLTGSRWYISLSGVEAVLRHRPRAVNECAAKAMALTTLPPSALIALPGPAPKRVEPGGNFLAISPGTGLGVAALISHQGKLVPVSSEAAHMDLTATSDAERRFVDYLQARRQPASNEALLSGRGLVSAYAALGDAQGLTRPEDVTRSTTGDANARAAVELFTEALGSLIGDLVLAFGAWDGVFITGSIARAIHPTLAGPALRRRLEDKGAFRRRLGEVPVAVVNQTDLELAGAAAALAG